MDCSTRERCLSEEEVTASGFIGNPTRGGITLKCGLAHFLELGRHRSVPFYIYSVLAPKPKVNIPCNE